MHYLRAKEIRAKTLHKDGTGGFKKVSRKPVCLRVKRSKREREWQTRAQTGTQDLDYSGLEQKITRR